MYVHKKDYMPSYVSDMDTLRQMKMGKLVCLIEMINGRRNTLGYQVAVGEDKYRMSYFISNRSKDGIFRISKSYTVNMKNMFADPELIDVTVAFSIMRLFKMNAIALLGKCALQFNMGLDLQLITFATRGLVERSGNIKKLEWGF